VGQVATVWRSFRVHMRGSAIAHDGTLPAAAPLVGCVVSAAVHTLCLHRLLRSSHRASPYRGLLPRVDMEVSLSFSSLSTASRLGTPQSPQCKDSAPAFSSYLPLSSGRWKRPQDSVSPSGTSANHRNPCSIRRLRPASGGRSPNR